VLFRFSLSCAATKRGSIVIKGKRGKLKKPWRSDFMTIQKGFGRSVQIAVAALFASLVFVITYAIPPITIPATSGYFNVGETVIYTVALIFGPLVGAVAGGIGAALADALLAPQFAVGTLIIKGLEGAIVGFLPSRFHRVIPNGNIAATVAVAVGGLEMVLGYFLYEQIILGYPLAAALVEVPFNLVQMAVGLAIAIPVVHAVRQVVPQLKS
jgi:uncharacterized membrane protein